MFESGHGECFETYVGKTSGSIYRLHLDQIQYDGRSRADLLAEAMELESRLAYVPKELGCEICGTTFCASCIPVDGQEMIEAFEIE